MIKLPSRYACFLLREFVTWVLPTSVEPSMWTLVLAFAAQMLIMYTLSTCWSFCANYFVIFKQRVVAGLSKSLSLTHSYSFACRPRKHRELPSARSGNIWPFLHLHLIFSIWFDAVAWVSDFVKILADQKPLEVWCTLLGHLSKHPVPEWIITRVFPNFGQFLWHNRSFRADN